MEEWRFFTKVFDFWFRQLEVVFTLGQWKIWWKEIPINTIDTTEKTKQALLEDLQDACTQWLFSKEDLEYCKENLIWILIA